MKNRRRPKGMGSVVYLGAGRRRPFLAYLRRKSLGTYKSEEDAEKRLLGAVLKRESMIPDFLPEKLTEDYAEYIYNLQKSRLLPESVFDFPDMEQLNAMYKQQLILSGKYVEGDEEIIESPTFAEIWEKEYERIAPRKSKSWQKARTSSFKLLSPIHDLKVPSIRLYEIQRIFDSLTEKGYSLSHIGSTQNVCNIVFDYAVKNGIISSERNAAKYLEVRSNSKGRGKRKVFTKNEIEILFNDNTIESKFILVYIFTGMRPIELLTCDKRNIHLKERYVIAGAKTESGKNRIIPIHKDIVNLFGEVMASDEMERITGENNQDTKYSKYRLMYKNVMNRLNLEHIEPYDTRHTFSTMAKVCHMDDSARKKIMGHKAGNLTDDVYTHEPVSFLIREMDKINLLDYC